MTVLYISMTEVVEYHRSIFADEGQPQVPMIAPEKLESALLRPSAEAFGTEAYPSLAEKAAVLLQGIVIAHPFLDGNKRAGLAAMLLFLEMNGVEPYTDREALYDFVIAVTTGELREVEDIAARVRELFALE